MKNDGFKSVGSKKDQDKNVNREENRVEKHSAKRTTTREKKYRKNIFGAALETLLSCFSLLIRCGSFDDFIHEKFLSSILSSHIGFDVIVPK